MSKYLFVKFVWSGCRIDFCSQSHLVILERRVLGKSEAVIQFLMGVSESVCSFLRRALVTLVYDKSRSLVRHSTELAFSILFPVCT